MKRFLIIVFFLTSAVQAGEVSGKVNLSGASRSSKKASVRYAGQTGGSAAKAPAPRAIVYLEGSFSASKLAAARKNGVIGQKDFRFQPNLLAVVRGSSISFPNRDSEYHNIFSYSSAKRFDLGRYKSTEKAPSITFDKAGAVRLSCEIHKHMRGTVLVLDTPYFTTSSTNGSYKLSGLPAGNYTLVAWVSERTQYREKVTLSADSRLTINLPGS